MIGPEGGELNAPDGSAGIVVPPGAVDQDTQFDYAPATPAPPDGLEDAGNAFDLSAQAQGTPVTQVNVPMTLTLDIGDEPEESYNGLGLFLLPAEASSRRTLQNPWEELESVIDLRSRTLTAATNRLGQFALFRRIIPPDFFWKAGDWRDYAPSGMPDFDQKQDNWRNAAGRWNFCGPVALANSLWWFDSKFEPNPIPPPVINDGYPLVQSYATGLVPWDDHDPRNVLPLVNDLAALAGTGPNGTTPPQMFTAIQNYLAARGLAGQYIITLLGKPGFDWVEQEIERSEDVVLLIGFWQATATGWRRIGGHYVTAVGVYSPKYLIAFSDPFVDAAELGGWGRVLPAGHPNPHGVGLHNDARFVSHDIYRVVGTQSPGGYWGPWGYTRWLLSSLTVVPTWPFQDLNTPADLLSYQGPYNPYLPVVAEVEYAIAVSPKDGMATPTPTPTKHPPETATPRRRRSRPQHRPPRLPLIGRPSL